MRIIEKVKKMTFTQVFCKYPKKKKKPKKFDFFNFGLVIAGLFKHGPQPLLLARRPFRATTTATASVHCTLCSTVGFMLLVEACFGAMLQLVLKTFFGSLNGTFETCLSINFSCVFLLSSTFSCSRRIEHSDAGFSLTQTKTETAAFARAFLPNGSNFLLARSSV